MIHLFQMNTSVSGNSFIKGRPAIRKCSLGSDLT
jgi:hypothetical protein